MEIVYTNGEFDVEADSRDNIYRVINKQTGFTEERCTNLYEAIRYCVIFKEGIANMMQRNSETTEWPPVNKDAAH